MTEPIKDKALKLNRNNLRQKLYNLNNQLNSMGLKESPGEVHVQPTIHFIAPAFNYCDTSDPWVGTRKNFNK